MERLLADWKGPDAQKRFIIIIIIVIIVNIIIVSYEIGDWMRPLPLAPPWASVSPPET